MTCAYIAFVQKTCLQSFAHLNTLRCMEKIKKNIDELLFWKVYYKLRQWVISNCDSSLYYKLRQVSYNQNVISLITNCDRYYKVRQVLQSAVSITKCDRYYKLRQVLQSATGITKCDRYYKERQVLLKVRQVLQIATGITKCDRY